MKETVLYERRTPFQKIVLTRLEPENEVALYLDEAIQFVSGFDDRVYHHVLAGLGALYHGDRPIDALILGGGDGLAARDLFSKPNIQGVTQVELDPGMIAFSARHPVMRQLNQDSLIDRRMDLRVGDARKFLAGTPHKRYDLAILDFPDPLTQDLEDLFSRRLYRQLGQHLSPGALIAAQASGAFSETSNTVRNRLKHIYGNSYVVRFRGRHMDDGAVVFAGRDLHPERLGIPTAWNARNGIQPLTLSALAGSVF